MFYHLSEGSEIFPLDWLMALKSVKTGKPFLEDPERFGLIQDPEAFEVPGYGRVKLPIGLPTGLPRDVVAAVATVRPSPEPPRLLAMNMVGVNCAACHVDGTNNVPDQSKSLPGLLSGTDVLTGKERKIGELPSYVTGPATRACGGCHRAVLINEDKAGELHLFNQHTTQGGYMVEAGEDATGTLQGVIDQMMAIFK